MDLKMINTCFPISAYSPLKIQIFIFVGILSSSSTYPLKIHFTYSLSLPRFYFVNTL